MMFTLKKIALFPISLFVAFLALMAKWLLTLSSYVVAPLMLYIFGCGIYTAYRQTWDQFFILLLAEFICFVLFFGSIIKVSAIALQGCQLLCTPQSSNCGESFKVLPTGKESACRC